MRAIAKANIIHPTRALPANEKQPSLIALQ
jgi:hypothetical protein